MFSLTQDDWYCPDAKSTRMHDVFENLKKEAKDMGIGSLLDCMDSFNAMIKVCDKNNMIETVKLFENINLIITQELDWREYNCP